MMAIAPRNNSAETCVGALDLTCMIGTPTVADLECTESVLCNVLVTNPHIHKHITHTDSMHCSQPQSVFLAAWLW